MGFLLVCLGGLVHLFAWGRVEFLGGWFFLFVCLFFYILPLFAKLLLFLVLQPA